MFNIVGVVKRNQKSTSIGVRVDPITRLALEQIAREKDVDLSIVTRWALHDYVQRQTAPQPVNRNQPLLALDA